MTSENLPIFSISTPRDYLGEGRGRKLVARRARPISGTPPCLSPPHQGAVLDSSFSWSLSPGLRLLFCPR